MIAYIIIYAAIDDAIHAVIHIHDICTNTHVVISDFICDCIQTASESSQTVRIDL